MEHDSGPPDDLGDETSRDHDLAAAIIDLETQKRLWLRSIIPLLQIRTLDSDPNGRVQLALDLMQIAACERVTRLLRSDLRADQG